MKTVSFECDDSSAQLFVQVLNKLATAGEKRQTRKIRIGGDEYSFIGGCDNVSGLSIDGARYSNFTDTEKQDLEALRSAIVTPVAPVQAPVTVQTSLGSATISTTVPSTPDSSTSVPDSDSTDILNSTDAVAVKDIISSKVGQNDMFTAFDITKALRANGVQVLHRNVKTIVHAFYNSGEMQGYDRSLVDVTGTPVRPFLYHPQSADPSTYQA